MTSSQVHDTRVDSTPSRRERTRVLLFTNSITVGGMEEHVELLARHLDRRLFEVYAMCPEWEGLEPFQASLKGVADHFAAATPDRRYGAARLLAETVAMARRIRAWGIDVMHMHSTTYRGQYYALLAARAAGVGRVFVTEHLAPERALPRRERLARDLLTRSVTGIVCVSHKNYVARSQHLYTPPERATVVNNGVDLDDFPEVPPEALSALRARYGIPEEAQIVGTAVRFEPEKGLSYLVDAMPKIKAECPRAHFLMVGDGSLRGELEAHVARLGLSSHVTWAGFQNDPRVFVRAMDAFVLPVPVGSMSIGLLEAMAMRRAVVITFGGVGEAVVDGESGLCPEPRNPGMLAGSIIRILKDEQFQRRLGEGAYQRVASEFSAQNVARSLGELYLNGKPQRAPERPSS